jgi:hypothetical protein
MHRTVIPAIVTMFALVVLVGGPDAPITGMIALKCFIAWLSSYIGCCLGDLLFPRRPGSGQ